MGHALRFQEVRIPCAEGDLHKKEKAGSEESLNFDLFSALQK